MFGAAAVLGLLMAAHALLETGRDALFLRSLSPDHLPWVYLIIAALAFVVTWFDRDSARSPGKRAVFPILVLVCAGVTSALWVLASSRARESWLLVVLYVWTGVYSTLMTVHFWLSLSSRYTVTQAKRLFGLVAGGGIVGAIVGSVGARVIAGVTETRHMLLLAAACMVAAAPLSLWVLGRRESLGQEPSEKRSLRFDLKAVTTSRYLVRLTALVVIATISVTLSSFIFKREVAIRIEPGGLAVFFATTNLAVNGVALFIQVVAVGWFLDRFGALRALSVLPLLLFAGGGAVAAGGGIVAALMLQGADGTLRHSLHRTAIEVLYVPVPADLRPAGKAVADILGHRGGQAVGSLSILLLLLVPTQSLALACALMTLCALWVVLALGVRPHYLELFRRTLTDNTMTDTVAPLDKSSLEELFASLNSRRDERVIAAVDLLAAHQKMSLVPALILHHPSKAVVTRALDLFTESANGNFVPVAMRLVANADPEVRAAALRAVTSVAPSTATLEEALKDETAEVRVTALVHLAHSGKIERGRALGELEEFLDHGDIRVRRAMASAIGACSAGELAPLIRRLARDEDVSVREEAIAAVRSTPRADFVDVLLEAIAERRLRSDARASLVAIGRPALEALADALSDDILPLRIRLHVPRSLSYFEPSEAIDILLARLAKEPRRDVQYKIIRALCHLRARGSRLRLDEERPLKEIVDKTLADARATYVWRVALESGQRGVQLRRTRCGVLLAEVLEETLRHLIERVLRLFSLTQTEEDYRRIYRGLWSSNPTVRAGALELLRSSLDEEYRDPTLGLIADEPDEHRLARLAVVDVPEYEIALEQMIEGSGETVAAFAAYHAGELGLLTLRPSVHRLSALRDHDWASVIDRAREMLDAARSVNHG